jgi:predicted transcriptional regulator
LRAATRAKNYSILQQLAAQPAISVSDLSEAVGQERLGLSERLNDLIQVGLASREIDTDQAQITLSGAGLVNLVNGISEQVANEYLAKKE